jgi:purine nucleosidase
MHTLIVDCDPGLDDAAALIFAATNSEIDLIAVTAVSGNRPVNRTAKNACDVLDLVGRSDVAVFAGCQKPISFEEPRTSLVFGEDGLGGVVLPSQRQPQQLHACDFLRTELLRQPACSITIAAIGPLTNLAEIEIKSPGVLRRAKSLLVMGGAFNCPGNVTPYSEFNFFADPRAADIVLRSGAHVELFGLDVTSQVRLTQDRLNLLDNSTLRRASVKALFEAHLNTDPALHDICPIAYLLRPKLFSGIISSVFVDFRSGLTEGQSSKSDQCLGSYAMSKVVIHTDVLASQVLDLYFGQLIDL